MTNTNTNTKEKREKREVRSLLAWVVLSSEDKQRLLDEAAEQGINLSKAIRVRLALPEPDEMRAFTDAQAGAVTPRIKHRSVSRSEGSHKQARPERVCLKVSPTESRYLRALAASQGISQSMLLARLLGFEP